MNKNLTKKILFISVNFFNYEKAIKKELENFGFEVDYYDERPSNNIFSKGLIRLKSSMYNYFVKKYYNSIIKNFRNKEYHYLFVLKGETIPIFFIEKFKIRYPDAQLIFYNWDSFQNNNNPLKFLNLFDKCFTFDHNDAIKYGLHFRPLFYLKQFAKSNSTINNFEYDLLFIGTAHSDRYLISNYISSFLKNNNLSTYTYYYIQSLLVYYFKKLFDDSFKYIDKEKISFRSLNINDILSLFDISKVILDIHHPNQVGLSMRTIEAIGAGKKLITTNKKIKEYNFYCHNNILIINRDNVNIDLSFFNLDYNPINQKVYDALSIRGWINSIFYETYINDDWFN